MARIQSSDNSEISSSSIQPWAPRAGALSGSLAFSLLEERGSTELTLFVA